jgi:hypothetical protein
VSIRSALTEGSDRDNFCSHSSQRCRLGTGAMQGVRRPGKSLRVVSLSGYLKEYCCKCVQSQRLQHLDRVEGLPQGVRARELPEGLESRGKAQEGQVFEFVEGLYIEVVVEVFERCCKFAHR